MDGDLIEKTRRVLMDKNTSDSEREKHIQILKDNSLSFMNPKGCICEPTTNGVSIMPKIWDGDVHYKLKLLIDVRSEGFLYTEYTRIVNPGKLYLHEIILEELRWRTNLGIYFGSITFRIRCVRKDTETIEL